MNKYFKIFIATLILMLSCAQYVLAKEQSVVVPEAWNPKKIINDRAYMNITGDYVLLGENAPGTPSFFMGEPQWRLYLDLMAGVDIGTPHEDRKHVTYVHIQQNDCTGLEFTFYSKNGVVARRNISGSEKVTITCNRESFKVFETGVGGVGRTMDDEVSYYLSEDGSLILHSKYKGTDRSQAFGIFWTNFKYEHLVKFNSVKP
jgi:hypothetical protein